MGNGKKAVLIRTENRIKKDKEENITGRIVALRTVLKVMVQMVFSEVFGSVMINLIIRVPTQGGLLEG